MIVTSVLGKLNTASLICSVHGLYQDVFVLGGLHAFKFRATFFFYWRLKTETKRMSSHTKVSMYYLQKHATNIALQPRFSQHNIDTTLRSRTPPWSSTAEQQASCTYALCKNLRDKEMRGPAKQGYLSPNKKLDDTVEKEVTGLALRRWDGNGRSGLWTCRGVEEAGEQRVRQEARMTCIDWTNKQKSAHPLPLHNRNKQQMLAQSGCRLQMLTHHTHFYG